MINNCADYCLQRASDYQIQAQDTQRQAVGKGIIGTTLRGAAVALRSMQHLGSRTDTSRGALNKALDTLNHPYAPIVEKRLFRSPKITQGRTLTDMMATSYESMKRSGSQCLDYAKKNRKKIATGALLAAGALSLYYMMPSAATPPEPVKPDMPTPPPAEVPHSTPLLLGSGTAEESGKTPPIQFLMHPVAQLIAFKIQASQGISAASVQSGSVSCIHTLDAVQNRFGQLAFLGIAVCIDPIAQLAQKVTHLFDNYQAATQLGPIVHL